MTYEFSDHQTINAPGGLLNFILQMDHNMYYGYYLFV